MYKNRFITCLSLLTVLLIFLSSCSYVSEEEKIPTISPSLTDRSWLTDEPCKAPCWYGLEPGKSTKEEAISTVKKLPFINPESMIIKEQDTSNWDGSYQEGTPSQRISFEYKDFPRIVYVFIQIENDILAWFVLLPIFDISFEQIVDQIGPPDYFKYSHINPEGKGCDVSLLWIDRQMQLTDIEGKRHFWEKDLCNRIEEAYKKIPPDLTVFQVLYMPKNWVEEKISQKLYFPWNGFIPSSP